MSNRGIESTRFCRKGCGAIGLLAGLLLVGLPSALSAQVALPQLNYRADFDFFWTTIRDHYAYFDRKQTDWNLVRTTYQPQADTIRSRRAFIRLLEKALSELYDNHASLSTNRLDSRRLVPTGSDIAAEWAHGQAQVLDVRPGYGAARTGVRPGMRVMAINGLPVAQAIQPFLPRCLRQADPAAYTFALNQALAGDHVTPRQLTLTTAHGTLMVRPDEHGSQLEHSHSSTRLTVARYGHIGYLKINNSLGDDQLIAAFDSALNTLRDTQGLVLDLRETPSGGNTSVARAIMGRFITRERPYQKHELPAEERETGIRRSWLELVSPRLPTYSAPLVVLAGRWTGSMGEGLTVGFDALQRATVVGTPLARLAGAVNDYTLPHSGISFNIPFERLYLVNGQPREQYVPSKQLNLVQTLPLGPSTDIGLNTSLALLKSTTPTRKTSKIHRL
ncbi:MAG: peptidase [Hymenobacter sp.]|nr:MAG: peptidase [Hymenobacter sp.]